MIDLVATGPVYRGHKLARIVEEYATGDLRGKCHVPPFGLYAAPTSTKAWARLDVRVIGNPWGLSVSEVCDGEGGSD